MKRIGVLTHYFNNKNLGGLLQAYALVSLLHSNKYIVEQISFRFQTYDFKSMPIRKELYLNNLNLTQKMSYILYCIKRYFNKLYLCSKLTQQNYIIKNFANDIAHSSEVYEDKTIENANHKYDIIIIGSDQVWNLDQLPHYAFWGEFTTSDKKVISYAASAGINYFLPKAEKLFIQKLSRINNISVREKTLKDYIEKISNKKAEVVLDPTFLLSEEDWLKIANSKIVPNKKYIFCYFLGGKSAWQRKVAQKYADKYGYEVLHLPYIMQTVRFADKYLEGQGRYDVGPREFISLINGAECIFTDSFHGMAFAINFNKDFYVFDRDDRTGKESMNARITDILEMLNLNTRHIINKDITLINAKIDYTQANKILEYEKQKSITWLLNVLQE